MPPIPFPPPTPSEVRAIADTADPVLRNHRITLGYHRLAVALANRRGEGGEGNWCAFAVWASRQAGYTIRGEDLRRALEGALRVSPELIRALEGVVAAARPLGTRCTVAELREALTRAVDLEGIVARSGSAVARGNQIVFSEVGSAVAEFLAEATGSAPELASAEATEEAPVPAGLAPPEGARYLRAALQRYDARALESEPSVRAELLLLANVEIGYHEQIRIQPQIEAAIHAAVPDAEVLRSQLRTLLLPGGGGGGGGGRRAAWLRARNRFWSFLGRPAPLDRALDRVLDRALDQLVAEARRPLRAALTRHIMALELPGGLDLRLGLDLTGEFPETLRELRHPELVSLLARIDPTPDSLEGTGVRDWAELTQRVHYIVDLFRRHQETPGLLAPPYPQEEAARILEGTLSRTS